MPKSLQKMEQKSLMKRDLYKFVEDGNHIGISRHRK